MSPNDPGSVTKWIEQLQAGSSTSFPDVWNRYFARLAEIADLQMANSPGRAIAGEDVASDVLQIVCRQVTGGKFPDLRDRSDLWNVLLKITQRKVASQKRHELRQKRGNGRVLLASDVMALQNGEFDINEIMDLEPTIDTVISIKDLCNHLIEVVLRDDKSKSIARLKLEGLTNAEIADQLQIASRTVERKLGLIRKLWVKELEREDDEASDGKDQEAS